MVRASKQVSPRGDDYTNYDQISWYLYNPNHQTADVDLFFRVGADTLNYYEVGYRFSEGSYKTGWKYMNVDLAELSQRQEQRGRRERHRPRHHQRRQQR